MPRGGGNGGGGQVASDWARMQDGGWKVLGIDSIKSDIIFVLSRGRYQTHIVLTFQENKGNIIDMSLSVVL